ncbi:MAG: hypothetical protein AB7I33_12010 [Gemmatimonadales bacterium]
MDNITPLPWRVAALDAGDVSIVSGPEYPGCEFVVTDGTGAFNAVGANDAALIVRAVNAHDDLVYAVKLALEHWHKWRIQDDPNVQGAEEAMKAALAKAEAT